MPTAHPDWASLSAELWQNVWLLASARPADAADAKEPWVAWVRLVATGSAVNKALRSALLGAEASPQLWEDTGFRSSYAGLSQASFCCCAAAHKAHTLPTLCVRDAGGEPRAEPAADTARLPRSAGPRVRWRLAGVRAARRRGLADAPRPGQRRPPGGQGRRRCDRGLVHRRRARARLSQGAELRRLGARRLPASLCKLNLRDTLYQVCTRHRDEERITAELVGQSNTQAHLQSLHSLRRLTCLSLVLPFWRIQLVDLLSLKQWLPHLRQLHIVVTSSPGFDEDSPAVAGLYMMSLRMRLRLKVYQLEPNCPGMSALLRDLERGVRLESLQLRVKDLTAADEACLSRCNISGKLTLHFCGQPARRLQQPPPGARVVYRELSMF